MKKLLFSFMLLFGILVVSAQSEKPEKSDKKAVKQKSNKLIDRIMSDNSTHYEDELNFGLRLHTNGFSGVLEKVWIKNINLKHLLIFEYFHYRDYREKKQNSIIPTASFYNTKKYYYGKQNNFFVIRAIYGNRKLIADKADKLGVRLMLTYGGGFSLGFEKPYHLEIVPEDASTPGNCCEERTSVSYNEATADVFLDRNRIFGYSGFTKGFSGITPVPGGHAKFGLNFDWANKEHFVKAIEIGAQVDVFYRKINVLVNSDANRPYIFNLYLSVLLGKRW